MLPPYLKSGSEFSAVQWRLFPLWASVVRGYWYLSLPNFFVKLLNSTLTECENQSNFFMQRLQGYHAWCINFWLRQFRFSWGCQLTLELPGFKSTHKIDYLRYQFFLWFYTGFSKGRLYWENFKSMLILHKLISWKPITICYENKQILCWVLHSNRWIEADNARKVATA